MWGGQRKSKVTCNKFLSSPALVSDAVTTWRILRRSSQQPSAPSDTSGSSAPPYTWAAFQPGSHPPLKPWRHEAGPTTCSTSRAVYLLIASLTIVHNNQLRHCQRNTHSWHHTRREVRAGWLRSSSHSRKGKVWGQRKSQ